MATAPAMALAVRPWAVHDLLDMLALLDGR